MKGENMFKNILTILLVFLFLSPVFGYQSSYEKNNVNAQGVKAGKKEGEFFVAASMTGASLGFKFRKPFRDDVTLLIFDIQVSSARGEKEAIYIDPYYGYPIKTGRNFITFFIPFYVGIQRRMFKESIEGNFRPYVIAEAGPVFGASFPTKYNFSKNLEKGRGQPTFGGFVGMGIEFGAEEASSSYAFGAGYRILSFFDELGEKKNYSSFVLKLGWVVRW